MRAVILAGGFATRLRPLSCSKPKLLFPIVGVPLVESMARWLSSNGVDQIILAVNHLSDRLRVTIGDHLGALKVSFSVEATPLGTGGPIKLAQNLLSDNEPFVVINGDIVTNIDLKGMLAYHKAKNPEATIALVSAGDPSSYGSVMTDSSGLIRKFIEKSDRGGGPDLVNAGVYIFSSQIVGSIPSGRSVSLERDIFPKLVETRRLQGWTHNGFWYDIGRIPDYIRANKELLKLYGRTGGGSGIAPGVQIHEPVFIGENSHVGSNAIIGPSSILSHSVSVGFKSAVKNSIVFEETEIGDGTIVEGSVVGERVIIGKNSKIGNGSIIAGQLTIPGGTTLAPNSTILC